MHQFLTDVSAAEDVVDLNLAAGSAVDRWARFKTWLLVGLSVAVVLLTIGYLNILREEDAQEARIISLETWAHEVTAKASTRRELILKNIKIAQQQRAEMLLILRRLNQKMEGGR